MLKHGTAPADDWVTALADAKTPLTFPWFGHDTVDPDWAFHHRILDDHLLYLVTDGRLHGTIDEQPVALGPGSLLWMQPRVRHTFLHGSTPAPLTLFFVRFRLGGGVAAAPPARTHQVWPDAWDLVGLFDELVDELATRLAHRAARLRALLVAICTAALRDDEPDTAPASSGALTRAQRRVIEGHVRAHPSRRSSPAELAALVGLSLDYFTRRFTRTFGVPPRVWLVDERLHRAARLLDESVRTITEVSHAMGYSDVSAFSHQFTQRFGISPRAFRQHRR